MDPMSVLALVNTCVSITIRIGTITKQLWTLKEKYKHVERKVVLFESQLAALSATATGLSEWLGGPVTYDEPIRKELKRSLESCDTVVQVIMEYLAKAQAQSNKMTLWNKTRFLRDEGTILEYEGMLRGQVQALSLLLQILTLPSQTEQKDQIHSFETTSILNQARDRSSSLLWLRDSESAKTITSIETENMETLDMTFDFDELIVTSKVYRSTLASFIKQKIKGDKKGKSILSQEVAASVPLLQDNEQTQAHFKVPMQPIIATTTSEFVVISSRKVPQTVVDSEVSNWALEPVASNDDSPLPPKAPPKSAGVESEFKPLTDQELDEILAEATSTGYFEPKMVAKRDWNNGIIGTGAFKHEGSTKQHDKGGVDSTGAFTPETSMESGGKDNITRTGDSESEMSTKWDESDSNYATDITSMISSSPSIGDDEIDFEFVYALHTFLAELEGQASVEKGDTLVLLDDSNPYWWLIRVIKDSHIGYLPCSMSRLHMRD